MINNLAELEPIEVAGIKLGDQCFEIHVHGALVECRATTRTST
jgi:hypothetical protein